MSDFDFEAFIAGAHLAEDTFDLYLIDNSRKIAALKADLEAATSGGDERESSVAADTADLEAQIAALVEEMRASKREFTLRAISSDELSELQKPEREIYDQLAIQSVTPKLDREQWKRIDAVVGAHQFGTLASKAVALATHEVAVPDFSPTDSTTQDQRESSVS